MRAHEALLRRTPPGPVLLQLFIPFSYHDSFTPASLPCVAAAGALTSINTPTRYERSLGFVQDEMEENYHLQTCLALVRSLLLSK